MDITVNLLGWCLAVDISPTADHLDDEGRPGAGAADRGLDLSTDRDPTERQDYAAGTLIDSEYPESRRTGF